MPVRPGPEPQSVLGPLTSAAIFLTGTVEIGGEQAARDLLADLAGLRRSVGFRAPEAGLTCVAGIGAEVWERLFTGPRPARLHPFAAIDGVRRRAVATPGDLLFHIRAQRQDLCFELAAQIVRRLGDRVRVRDEVSGFRYFDERDLLGFVDGTENPAGQAAADAVLVGDQDPPFAGGSYVIVQKYLHDMRAWNELSVADQERVIGRTKLSNIELPDDAKPANSHVALTTITGPDGEQRQILRDNMPFGSPGAGEFGTYFIGYAADPAVTEEMLANMFTGRPPGNYDRVLDYSVPVTGCLFFVPPADFLDDLPAAPTAGAAGSRPDGALGIGDLRGGVRQ
ncbi:MAG: Dyp-type peroxidase [Actinomycetota bacterium]|nr:Dyp-type peroxidase [Actinomycetota bacterium]